MLVNAAPGIPVFGPSGASAHLRGVAQALRPERVVCAVDVDRRGRHGVVEAPVVAVGVPGWPSWLSRWRDYREVLAARRVAREVMKAPPTLLWERHSLYSDAGWKVHAATGCRWILEVNAPLVEERLRYEALGAPGWARRWEREVLRAAPEVVAVSRWLVDWLRGEVGCTHVRWLPNGVEARVGDRAAARARLGLGEEPVVGFVGSMKPWHGLSVLPAVLDALPEAVGLLVGDGPVEVAHPRLRRVGRVEEVADLVAAMDVGLAPYPADAPPWFCPLKVLDYRAQGTPVVATDVGDCRALVGEAGTVLPAGAGAGELAEAARAWFGRRTTPWVRSWERVVREGLGKVGEDEGGGTGGAAGGAFDPGGAPGAAGGAAGAPNAEPQRP